ncbi:hypothetical protein [Brevundimonas sp.]|uniref:hypothetical protein n=1 Tax=Brevundimonas sp. TaxID=1871086 RepID=UPI002E1585A7|nr:hypothetical protein [Brevundimonas sp.]
MTRALLLSVACAAAALFAAPAAMAQSDERPQLRRLDWAGRPAPSGAELRRAAPVIPHAGAAPSRVALRPAQPWRPTAGQIDGRPGLTPATAFAGPAAPSYAPPSVETPPVEGPRPAPVRSEPAPQPRPAPVQAQRPAPPATAPAQPTPQPVREPEAPPARLVQPSPVSARVTAQPEPQPQAQTSVVDDPMAPRRDAPIFRIQGARQPQAAPPVETPPVAEPTLPAAAPLPAPVASTQPTARQQGARYYSVHRQNGRVPDPTVLPEPVWLDRMPVQLDSTPQSEDLAAPPETPQMVRGSDGKMRPVQGAQGDPIP